MHTYIHTYIGNIHIPCNTASLGKDGSTAGLEQDARWDDITVLGETLVDSVTDACMGKQCMSLLAEGCRLIAPNAILSIFDQLYCSDRRKYKYCLFKWTSSK